MFRWPVPLLWLLAALGCGWIVLTTPVVADLALFASRADPVAELLLAGRDYAFVGTMDRVDKRDGLFHVLDYKTGGIKKLDGSLWTDLAATLERGRFDAITARALATLPLILELGGHLLKPEGRLLAMKGVVPEDEIAALPAGWRVAAVHPLRVPGLDAERHLLEVVKSPG